MQHPHGPWMSITGLSDRLVVLHSSPENLSFSQIAHRLNDEFQLTDAPLSRSACIARSHRIGLQPRLTSARDPRKFRHYIEPAAPKKPPSRGPPSRRCQATESPPLSPVIPKDPVKLLELGPNDCRYPFGHMPNLMFCGQNKIRGSSYCAEHTNTTRNIPLRVRS